MRLDGLDARTLGLTLLSAAGVLLLLYLLRRPTRRVVVPWLALWLELVPERKRASALFRRLRGLVSLLLALAIAGAVVFALGDPERGLARPGRSVVLLIDRSASMGARDVRPSRLEQAKARAHQWLAQLGSDDRALVAALDDGLTPLSGFSADRAELGRAIDGVAQGAAGADLGRALSLVSDLAAGRSHPELVLFSDGNLRGVEAAERQLADRPELAARYERVGESARNVGITRFSARRYPLDKTHYECLVAVTNFGRAPEPLRLQIRAAGQLLYETSFTLAPGAHETRAFADLPGSEALLEAGVLLARGADPLAADDRAFAQLPPRPRPRVLSVSRGNRYLEAALLLDESLEVSELAPEAYQGSAGFDVAIFDGVLPARPPESAALYLGPPLAGEGAFPLARRGVLERPFCDRVQESDALVQGLALYDANIARATRLALAPGDRALASTREGAPLIVEGARDGLPFVALAFDLRASDLPLRPAWPLLLLRALDRLTGDAAREAPPVHASIPAEEGAIGGRAALFRHAHAPPPAAPTRLPLRIWPLLVLAALILLTLEWLTFHRRWTV